MTRANVRTREDAEHYLEELLEREDDLEQEAAELQNLKEITAEDCPRKGLYNMATAEVELYLAVVLQEIEWVTEVLKREQFPPVENSSLDPVTAYVFETIAKTGVVIPLEAYAYKVDHNAPPVTGLEPSTDVIPDYLK